MAALIVFPDKQLIVDFLFEFRHVGDDADELIAAGQALEHADGLPAGVVIKGAEAFIDEHDIEVDGGGVGLYLVGKPQCQ